MVKHNFGLISAWMFVSVLELMEERKLQPCSFPSLFTSKKDNNPMLSPSTHFPKGDDILVGALFVSR